MKNDVGIEGRVERGIKRRRCNVFDVNGSQAQSSKNRFGRFGLERDFIESLAVGDGFSPASSSIHHRSFIQIGNGTRIDGQRNEREGRPSSGMCKTRNMTNEVILYAFVKSSCEEPKLRVGVIECGDERAGERRCACLDALI